MPRIIFALDIEPVPPSGKGLLHAIVWLNRDGQSNNPCWAVGSKRRIIHLRIGDSIHVWGQHYKIMGIMAFRHGVASKQFVSMDMW